jgi:hypothetical protein
MEYDYLKKWTTIPCIYPNVKNEEQKHQLAHGLWRLDVNFMRIHVQFLHTHTHKIKINNNNNYYYFIYIYMVLHQFSLWFSHVKVSTSSHCENQVEN